MSCRIADVAMDDRQCCINGQSRDIDVGFPAIFSRDNLN